MWKMWFIEYDFHSVKDNVKLFFKGIVMLNVSSNFPATNLKAESAIFRIESDCSPTDWPSLASLSSTEVCLGGSRNPCIPPVLTITNTTNRITVDKTKMAQEQGRRHPVRAIIASALSVIQIAIILKKRYKIIFCFKNDLREVQTGFCSFLDILEITTWNVHDTFSPSSFPSFWYIPR